MSGGARIALVTCADLPEPDVDEALLTDALRARGSRPSVVAWNDPDIEWAAYDCAVLRSCWDYHYPDRTNAFAEWVSRVDQETALVNPARVVSWNAHKRYLLELELAGVPIVPTMLVRHGDSRSLEHAVSDAAIVLDTPSSTTSFITKPAVGAGSRETRRHARGSLHIDDNAYRQVVAAGDVLIQPYVQSVETTGERCLIWIDGSIRHAIRKYPRLADDPERVSDEPEDISDDERSLADAALDAAQDLFGGGANLLYARVDLVRDESGTPLLAELELIEPSLFLLQSPATCDAFADAIIARASSSQNR